MKLNYLLFSTLLTLSISAHAINNALALPRDANGHVGQSVEIKCLHSFEIYNNKNSYQNYLVMEKSVVNGHELKKGWGFSLAPYQLKKFSEVTSLYYVPTQKGQWLIEGTTSVAGQPSAVYIGKAKLIID